MTGLLTTLYPGVFLSNVLDAARPDTARPKFYLQYFECQLRAKTLKKADADKLSTVNSNYYSNLCESQPDTHYRRQSCTCVPEQCHVTHGVRLLTHFGICRIQLKKLQATIHDLANLL